MGDHDRTPRRLRRDPRLSVAGAIGLLLTVPFAMLLLAAEISWHPLRRVDQAIAGMAFDTGRVRPNAVRLMVVLTDVFGPWVWRVLVVACAVWLFRRGAARTAVWGLAAILSGGALGGLVKVLTARARPADPLTLAAGTSFPSGHALTATIGCGVLLVAVLPLLRGRWRAVAWAVAVAVPLATGLTRVGLGVHWSSDVVAGWILGTAILFTTAAMFRPEHHRGHPTFGSPEPGEKEQRGLSYRGLRAHR